MHFLSPSKLNLIFIILKLIHGRKDIKEKRAPRKPPRSRPQLTSAPGANCTWQLGTNYDPVRTLRYDQSITSPHLHWGGRTWGEGRNLKASPVNPVSDLYMAILSESVTGCSQGPPKEGFVMRSRTQGIQEILEIYRCPHPNKSELGDGTHGAGPLRVILHISS